jgi:hypothetical protein
MRPSESWTGRSRYESGPGSKRHRIGCARAADSQHSAGAGERPRARALARTGPRVPCAKVPSVGLVAAESVLRLGGLSPLPAAAESVAAYIAECAGRLKPGSIQRRLNAIAEAHKAAGLESPTHAPIVRNTLKGIRRTLGTAPVQKTAALTDDIRAMVDATGYHWRAR